MIVIMLLAAGFIAFVSGHWILGTVALGLALTYICRQAIVALGLMIMFGMFKGRARRSRDDKKRGF